MKLLFLLVVLVTLASSPLNVNAQTANCTVTRHNCKQGDYFVGMYDCLFQPGKSHTNANLLPQVI